MVNTVFLGLYQLQQEVSQIDSVGRRALLVIHYLQQWLLLPQLQHGFDKVVAVFAVYPGSTHNEVLRG
ncbi:hypothetical protein D3C73_1630880 [compost metagenome]